MRAYDPKADTALIDAAYALADAGACAASSATTAIPTSPIRSRSPTSWPATGWTPPASSPRLLHDVIEDTPRHAGATSSSSFGGDIAGLVDGVTKLTRLELQSDRTKQAENFRKLVLAMSRDIRVLLVKLADRLHNMRTLHYVADAGAPPAHRPRDDGDLRAARRAHRHGRGEDRAADPRLRRSSNPRRSTPSRRG